MIDPFFFAAGGCFIGFETVQGRLMAILGVLGIEGAFAVASTRVLVWPPTKLAYVAKKTLMWAKLMRVYFVSSLAFWLTVLVLLLIG